MSVNSPIFIPKSRFGTNKVPLYVLAFGSRFRLRNSAMRNYRGTTSFVAVEAILANPDI